MTGIQNTACGGLCSLHVCVYKSPLERLFHRVDAENVDVQWEIL